MAKSKSLVLQHLEDTSWRVLEEYPHLVRDLIRGRAGVYALYRRDKLYYVGLANNLMGRLTTHLRDRHHGAWDRFAVYLTANADHIRELECLTLRIIQPAGNVQSGKFARSENLHSILYNQVKEADADRRAMILGGSAEVRRRRSKARRSKGSTALSGHSDRSTPLRATHGTKVYRAVLRPDGRIRFSGRIYDSPSAASRAAIRRSSNGWSFWQYRSKGKWVPLGNLRK